MLKAIIIDDEYSAIESLKWELDTYCKEINIIDSFTNPIEAISAVNYLKPDLVFLDIEMPEMDGFQLLSELNYKKFALIITTAYNHYAIQAIKENAVDYLLKPIDTDELKKAVQRAKARIVEPGQWETLLKSLVQEPDHIEKVPLALADKIIMVDKNDIVYCSSDGNYTHVFLNDGREYLLSKTIKVVEGLLDGGQFIRIHKKYMVNSNHIKEYTRGDGGYVVLNNDKVLPVSRMHKENLLRSLRIIT